MHKLVGRQRNRNEAGLNNTIDMLGCVATKHLDVKVCMSACFSRGSLEIKVLHKVMP